MLDYNKLCANLLEYKVLIMFVCVLLQQVSPASSSGPSPSRSFKAVNGSPGQIGGSRSQSVIQRPVSSIVSSQQPTPGSRDPTRRQSIPSGAHPRPPQIIPENGPQQAMRSSDGPKMVCITLYVVLFVSNCQNVVVYSEPLLKDTLNKGHNTFDLSIKDKFCGPYRTMAIQFYLLTF